MKYGSSRTSIVAAAFATLLLLTGSTLMQAYRERIHAFGVMKTLGFTDRASRCWC